MAEEVRIDLKSAADTSGFDKISAASKEAGAGIGAASKESKALAGELGRSVEVGSASVGLFQNLATASKGGAAGLAAAARAGLGFGQMLKGILAGAGPIGIALAAVGVAAGALVSIFSDTGKSADEAKTKLDELNKLKLDAAKLEIDNIGRAASDATRAINDQFTALQRIADVELAMNVAKVRAQGLSKDAEAAEIKRLQRARERAKMDAEQQKLDTIAETLSISAADVESTRQKRAAELAIAENKIARVKNAERAIRTTRPTSTTGSYGMSLGQSPEDTRLAAELEAAKKAAEGINLETLRKSLADATEASRAAQLKAEEAERAAAQERSTQGKTRPMIEQKNKYEDQAEDPAAKAAREEARRKQVEEMQRVPESTWRGRAASGFPVDADVFKEAFPKAKPLPAARLTDSINKAADAAEQAPDPKPAADAAERLATATKTSAEVQAAANAAVVSALSAAVSVASQSVATTQALTSQVVAMRSQMATLSSQLAASRQRIAS
ncbi:MAG: hypothetical protein BWX69_03219 [Planctomycetes bacterium ADurb.Bin069]|nr:MAG: hypothetical protein BWX69_03219 [Planctomycetes bacterium ADurb.Bin069]